MVTGFSRLIRINADACPRRDQNPACGGTGKHESEIKDPDGSHTEVVQYQQCRVCGTILCLYVYPMIFLLHELDDLGCV